MLIPLRLALFGDLVHQIKAPNIGVSKEIMFGQ